jgi:hypothetical protein
MYIIYCIRIVFWYGPIFKSTLKLMVHGANWLLNVVKVDVFSKGTPPRQ